MPATFKIVSKKRLPNKTTNFLVRSIHSNGIPNQKLYNVDNNKIGRFKSAIKTLNVEKPVTAYSVSKMKISKAQKKRFFMKQMKMT